MIFLILLLNFGISWLNCWALGGMWAESKAIGGFTRFLAWCGAIQSAIGFSSVVMFVLGWIVHATGYLPEPALKAALQLWYVMVIIPAIGTGLFITTQSWVIAFRTRSLIDMGSAAYNTFAQIHNMYSAYENLGDAFSGVGDFFSDLGDSEDGVGLGLVVIALVLCALFSGILMTYVLIRKYAGRLEIPAAALSR